MKLTRRALVSLVTAGAFFAPPSAPVEAQEQAQPPAQEEPADAVRMSLGECLQKALENNLDLAIARKDPETAANGVTLASAPFDPVLSVSAGHSDSKSELTPIFANGQVTYGSSQSVGDTFGLNWKDKLQFGADYEIDLSPAKSRTSPPSSVPYNPDEQVPLRLTFNLPLWKGLGREVNTQAILVAKKNVEISHEELRRQATSILQTVENAYWDLRAAREGYRVAEQTLQLSKDLYDLNKKKVEVGTLAPIEITQAEANVASNVEGVIRTKTAVEDAEDNLRRLLAIPPGNVLWTRTIIPTEPPESEARDVNTEVSTATALTQRPEILSARKDLENAELTERVAKNAVKPDLSFNLSVTPSGNNLIDVQEVQVANPNPPPATLTDTKYSVGGWADAFKEAPYFKSYRATAGITYVLPIGNRAAKVGLVNAEIAREKSELNVQNVEEQIRVDVRTAARAVQSGYERVVAARKNVELQQKKLDAEQKKFDNGMSTSFEVFTFQTDLRNAQLSLIQALLDYNKALADIERAKGTLLEARGLKLDDTAGR